MADSELRDGPDQSPSKETDTAHGSSPLTPQPGGSSRHSTAALGVFQIVNLLVGIMGVVGAFYLPGIFPKVAVVVGAALLVAILYSPFINKCIKAIYVLIPFIIFVGIVVYLSLVMSSRPSAEEASNRAQPSAPLAPNEPSNRTPQEEAWASWTTRVSDGVAKCDKKESETGKERWEECVAEAIATPYPSPDPESDSPLARLYGDTRAGHIIMALLPRVKQMLGERVGVKPEFTGAGFAVPNDPHKFFWNARVHEYLVKNLSDNDPAVWSWQLEPDAGLKLKVDELINDAPLPELLQSRDRKKLIEGVNDNCGLADPTPAVIRFGRFQTGNYTNKLARNERKRVFVLHLCAVRHLTIKEAAHLSGYQLTPGKLDPTKGPERLYIWVYLPSHPDHIIEATWENILKNLKSWLTEK